MVRHVEKLSKWRFSEGSKTLFSDFFANTADASFDCYTSITELSAIQNLPDLDDAMIQCYLNFLKFHNLEGTFPHTPVATSPVTCSFSTYSFHMKLIQ